MYYCTECGKKLVNGKCPDCDSEAERRKRKPEKQDRQLKRLRSSLAGLMSKKTGVPEDEPALQSVTQHSLPRGKKPMSPKKKKILIVCAGGAVVLIAAAAVLVVFLMKDAQYSEAIQMLADERPEAAAETFEELDGYRESAQFLEECSNMIAYFEAQDQFDEGDYQEAADNFASLNDYKDAQELGILSQNNADYETASVLYDSGNFAEAKAAYLALGSFEDSADIAQDCQVRLDYQEATELMNNGEYQQAREIFLTIEDYEDSEDKAFVCYCQDVYQKAQEKIAIENYERALQLLEQVQNNINMSEMSISDVFGDIDFLQVKEDCEHHVYYERGVKLYDQGKYYSAHQAFLAAGNLFDAESRAAGCVQPIKTAEIYVNPNYTRNSVRMTFYAPKTGEESICIKVYDISGDLVSVCLVKNNERLRIYLPNGTYYYKYCLGTTWFGDEEYFGKDFHRVKFNDGSTTQWLDSYYVYWIEF